MLAIDCNTDLLAYEYYKNLYVPKEIYPSGEKEETSLIDKYWSTKETPALLTLEEDIVNKEGKGLKRGFYNVVPDKYLDFLLFFQMGQLKAKIPVVKTEVFETINPEPQKPKRMSAKKYQKEQEKLARKYFKGMNPDEVDYKNVEIFKDKENNSYVIIYQDKNLELTGVIKL